MQCKQSIPQHNEFNFTLSNEREVRFSSNFDSGNCGNVTMLSNSEFQIDTSPDFDSTSQTEGWSKSWFHFRVSGLASKARFHILRLKMLYNLWSNGNINSYKPVYRVGEEGEFSRLMTPVILDYDDKENVLRLTFSYDFSLSKGQDVYFSFSYPYTYKRNMDFINGLTEQFKSDPDIYFNKEILTYTPQLRLINLLTISSHDDKTTQKESYLSDALFPERDYEERAIKFKSNKPIVLISARVHPGETPASFALEGFLKFLLNKKDLRAALLRKYFTFWVVPMLNPDGVYSGHYRMDIYNQNLNRFYQIANNSKQPSIYAMKKVISQLSLEGRLFFYMDFHSHAGKKGTFLYGNALEDFSLQVENQVFAKIMAVNDPYFEYNYCNFSKAQMKSKDRQEDLTKEGCGRVFVYQTSKIVHSYTLECGFHHPTQLNIMAPCTNADLKVKIDDKEYSLDENDKNMSTQVENSEAINHFTPSMFEESGKAILISILDVYEKNPYSRIGNSQYNCIENIRKETAVEVARTERIRQEDAQSYSKAKNIINLINENFFSRIEQMRLFVIKEKIDWPSSIRDDMTKKYTGYNLPPPNTSPQNRFKKSLKQRGTISGFKESKNSGNQQTYHHKNNNSIGGGTYGNSNSGYNQLAQSFDVETNFLPTKRNQSQNEGNSQSSNLIKAIVESQFSEFQGLNQNLLFSDTKTLQTILVNNTANNLSSSGIHEKDQIAGSILPTDQSQRSPEGKKQNQQNPQKNGNVVIILGQKNQQQQQQLSGQYFHQGKFQQKRQRCLTDADGNNNKLAVIPSNKIGTSHSPSIQPLSNGSSIEMEQRLKLLSIINQKQPKAYSVKHQISSQQNTQYHYSLNNTNSIQQYLQDNLKGTEEIANNDPSYFFENSQMSPFHNDDTSSTVQLNFDVNNQTLQQPSNQQKSPVKPNPQQQQISLSRKRGSHSYNQESLNLLSEQINQVKQQVAASYYQEGNPIFCPEKSGKANSNAIKDLIQNDISLNNEKHNLTTSDNRRFNSRKRSKCVSQNSNPTSTTKPYSDILLQVKQQENTVCSSSSNSSTSNPDMNNTNLQFQLIEKYYMNQNINNSNNNQSGNNQDDMENKKIFNQVIIKAGKSSVNLQDKDDYRKYIEQMQNYFNSMSIKSKIMEKDKLPNNNINSSKSPQPQSHSNIAHQNPFEQSLNHRNSLTPNLLQDKSATSQNHIYNATSGEKINQRNNFSLDSRQSINKQQRVQSTKVVNQVKQPGNIKVNQQQIQPNQLQQQQLQPIPPQQIKLISNTQPNEKLQPQASNNDNLQYVQDVFANKRDLSNNAQKNNQYLVSITDISETQLDEFSKRINFLGGNFKTFLTSSKNNKGGGLIHLDRSFDSNFKGGQMNTNYPSNMPNHSNQQVDTRVQTDLFRTRNQSSVSPPMKYMQPHSKYQIVKQALKIPCPSINDIDMTNQASSNNNNANFNTPYNNKLNGLAKTSGKSKQMATTSHQHNISPDKFSFSSVNQQNKTFKLPNLKFKVNIDKQ